MSDEGWTEQRRRLRVQLAERNELLAEYYASAVYFLATPEAPARMSHLAHAVRELCLHLPDVVGVVKLDRSQSDARYAEFIKAWEAAGLSDDADGFRVSGEVDGDVPMCLVPRPVVEAGVSLVIANRVRGNSARRAALMIAEPHAPGGHTRAERDPAVRRWSQIIDDTFFPFVHAFDKRPAPVTEEDLHRDFAFLEEVMRGVLAPLEHVADLDELLAETERMPGPPGVGDSQGDRSFDAEPGAASAAARSGRDARRRMTDERLGGWPEPTDAQIQRLKSLTAHPARLQYFFSRLENPRWLARLADDGGFDPERVPEPIAEADGTVRIDPWPLSEYLRRVAGELPVVAASVIGRLSGTANPIVQRDLIAALLRLPAASAAEFTNDVIAWIRGSYARWLDEKDLSELAARLLDEGQQEVGRHLASVILVWLEGSYWLREAIVMLSDPLQRSGIEGVLVLADALGRVIGDERSAEMANFSRASIADHEQDQHIDAAGHLIDGLRDGALAYLRRSGDLTVLAALRRRAAALYTRIVYYVTAAAVSEIDVSGIDPAAASRSESLLSYARGLVMDQAAFASSRTRLEYGTLTRTMLGHLTSDDIAQFAGWIRQGPPMSDTELGQMLGSPGTPAAAEHVAVFRDHWRADRIALLGPELPEPLRAIATDLSARGVRPPKHPGFSHWTSMEPVIGSPVSAQELASMSVTDVIELARAYRPPPHMVFRFPEYALVQQVTEDVAARPTEYSLHASSFADLQPGYVNAFLNGLRQAIEAHGRNKSGGGAAPPLELTWDQMLELAAGIAERPDPGGRNAEQQEDSPRWLHRAVGILLKAALTAPGSGLSAQYADATLAVLRTLLNSPDPLPHDEAEDEALDPADRALNSVRGQAVGCLVAFADWWRRLGRTEADAPPVLLELLSAELDPTRETSTAVRTVYGQFFPHLHIFLPGWTSEHLGAIFGSPATESEINQRGTAALPEQTPAEQLGQAAFDAYLLANGPQDRSYLALLKSYYEREIVRLRRPPRAWRSALRNTRQTVLDHLLLFMLWGALDTDDPLVKLAIRKAGVSETGAAVGHLGWLIFRAGETDPSLAQRAQALWSWWRDRAQTRAINGDRDSAGVMVAGFPWWWRSGNLDITWQFRELLLVLEIAPTVETPGLVTQTIAERVQGNEPDAITALDIILDNTANVVQLQDAVMKAQLALRHLLRASDAEIRRRTAALVQKIAGWGMVELAKHITSVTS